MQKPTIFFWTIVFGCASIGGIIISLISISSNSGYFCQGQEYSTRTACQTACGSSPCGTWTDTIGLLVHYISLSLFIYGVLVILFTLLKSKKVISFLCFHHRGTFWMESICSMCASFVFISSLIRIIGSSDQYMVTDGLTQSPLFYLIIAIGCWIFTGWQYARVSWDVAVTNERPPVNRV